jgi:hypothetical protein
MRCGRGPCLSPIPCAQSDDDVVPLGVLSNFLGVELPLTPFGTMIAAAPDGSPPRRIGD